MGWRNTIQEHQSNLVDTAKEHQQNSLLHLFMAIDGGRETLNQVTVEILQTEKSPPTKKIGTKTIHDNEGTPLLHQ